MTGEEAVASLSSEAVCHGGWKPHDPGLCAGRRFTPTGTIDLGYRSLGRKKKVSAAAKQAAVPLQQSQPQAQAQPQPSPQA